MNTEDSPQRHKDTKEDEVLLVQFVNRFFPLCLCGESSAMTEGRAIPDLRGVDHHVDQAEKWYVLRVFAGCSVTTTSQDPAAGASVLIG